MAGEEGNTTSTGVQNQSEFLNVTDGLAQTAENAFTNISLGLGSCITIINVTMMSLLWRHKKCFNNDGFWQQLVFLCSSDILSGLAIALPPFGYLFYDIQADIYYIMCTGGLFIFPLSITLSAGNCFIISIQRYMVLKEPNTIWHKRATPIMAVSNVLLCIVTVLSSMLVITIIYGFQHEQFCDKVNMSGQNAYKSKYSIGCIMILVAFLIGTNIFSLLSILKIKTRNQSTRPVNSTNSLTLDKLNRYATITFILLVMALNFTTIPSLVFLLVSIGTTVNVSTETTEILSRLMTMNSLLNPFIYCFRTTSFRSAVFKDIKIITSRVRCSNDTAVAPKPEAIEI